MNILWLLLAHHLFVHLFLTIMIILNKWMFLLRQLAFLIIVNFSQPVPRNSLMVILIIRWFYCFYHFFFIIFHYLLSIFYFAFFFVLKYCFLLFISTVPHAFYIITT